METTTRAPSRLLQYLPSIYSEDPFLGQFLLAFEEILLGREVAPAADGPAQDQTLHPRGLEQIIDNLATLYDPINTPEEFLPWLSKWTALSLRADMTLLQQRRFIEKVIQLYKYRGTQENLLELLELFLTARPTITVDEKQPYLFHVVISLARQKDPEVARRQREIAQALIELEKPAHTDYTLQIDTPTLKIGEFSTVGVNTLLGTSKAATADAAGHQPTPAS